MKKLVLFFCLLSSIGWVSEKLISFAPEENDYMRNGCVITFPNRTSSVNLICTEHPEIERENLVQKDLDEIPSKPGISCAGMMMDPALSTVFAIIAMIAWLSISQRRRKRTKRKKLIGPLKKRVFVTLFLAANVFVLGVGQSLACDETNFNLFATVNKDQSTLGDFAQIWEIDPSSGASELDGIIDSNYCQYPKDITMGGPDGFYYVLCSDGRVLENGNYLIIDDDLPKDQLAIGGNKLYATVNKDKVPFDNAGYALVVEYDLTNPNVSLPHIVNSPNCGYPKDISTGGPSDFYYVLCEDGKVLENGDYVIIDDDLPKDQLAIGGNKLYATVNKDKVPFDNAGYALVVEYDLTNPNVSLPHIVNSPNCGYPKDLSVGGPFDYSYILCDDGHKIVENWDIVIFEDSRFRMEHFTIAAASKSCDLKFDSVIDLGTLGGTSSFGYDVNSLGQVVGMAEIPGDDNLAFFWDEYNAPPMQSLGDSSIRAYGINDSSQVVGWNYFTAVPIGSRPFLWENGTLFDLGTFGGKLGIAYDINESGQVVGFAHGATHSSHAFLWEAGSTAGASQNPQMRDLGTLSGDLSWAYGINNLCQVVGSASRTCGGQHAFMWDKNRIDGNPANPHMIDLGTLGGDYSIAFDINDSSRIVGMSQSKAGEMFAFLWEETCTNGISSNPRMINLGSLCCKNSAAYGINNYGHIVGESEFKCTSGTHAFLWQNGVMVDLNSLLPGDSKWELTHAESINDNGWITGWGLINGQTHAFLLKTENKSAE